MGYKKELWKMFGIAGIGISLPETLVSTWGVIAPQARIRESLKDKLGCNFVPLAQEDEGPMLFSIRAAVEALAEAGVRPEEVDMVLSNSLSADYDRWQSSAYVAHTLGCTNAESLDMYGGCNTTGMAWKLAVDTLTADESVNTILIALTEHCGGGTFPQFIGDGACAIVLKRGCEDFVPLDYSNLNEFMPSLGVMREGGVVQPFDENTRFDGGWEDQVDFNVEKYRKEVKPVFHEMSTKPFWELFAKTGIKPLDVDKYFIVHQQASYHQKLLDALGVPQDKMPIHYLENLGHISGFDTFIAMKWAKRDGLIKKGDLLAVMAMGLGEWHNFLIRY
jgi:3-oxoacyl-[acyl-carrier-protein] synthase III